jgi:phosphate starvation-inducible protein PhoH and related proteins
MSKKKKAKLEAQINATPNEKKDTSPKVYQRDKIKQKLNIRERSDFSEKQKEFINLVLDRDTKVVFVSGPAGTSKTFLAIYCALQLLNGGRVSDLVYVRSIIESASKSFGTLPGGEGDKLAPFLMPLYDKLEELLPKPDIDMLDKEERIKGIPINYLRGASINAKCVIVDEAQNLDKKELTTVLTRIGEFSRFLVLGDPNQSDINGRSGFMPMFDLFNDETSRNNGIHCFAFTHEDIVRSGILKYIVERIEMLPPSSHK